MQPSSIKLCVWYRIKLSIKSPLLSHDSKGLLEKILKTTRHIDKNKNPTIITVAGRQPIFFYCR